MPNVCDNRLAICGPPEAVMQLVRTLESEEQALDFNTLIPTPDELNGPEGEAVGESGFPRWYEWNRTNWGVKWNTWEVVRRGYGRTGRVRYRFCTAYGPPAEFLDCVAARWPEVTMTLTFDVELLGDGDGLWRDGVRVKLHDEVPW
jgi:hypothetical protein